MWRYNCNFSSATFLIAALISLAIHVSLAQNSPEDYVDAHNAIRSQVGVGPLTWSNTLAVYAQLYAFTRVLNCALEHSMGPYGENIAEGYDNLDGVEAVALWAGEKPNYDYGSNSCVGDECRHYTQIVWRDSVHLGCGRARCLNGSVFVTCNYEPPGNVIGESPY